MNDQAENDRGGGIEIALPENVICSWKGLVSGLVILDVRGMQCKRYETCNWEVINDKHDSKASIQKRIMNTFVVSMERLRSINILYGNPLFVISQNSFQATVNEFSLRWRRNYRFTDSSLGFPLTDSFKRLPSHLNVLTNRYHSLSFNQNKPQCRSIIQCLAIHHLCVPSVNLLYPHFPSRLLAS